VGKLRPRWKDVVRRDTTEFLGILGWRRRAEGREEWRRLLKETRAPEGAVALQMDGWMGTVSGKTKTKMEGRRPEGHNRDPGNTRMEKTRRRQRRMEASSEGDLGPRRGCGTTDGWMGTVSGKTKTKMEGRRPGGHNRDPRNTRMEKTSRRQRRIEASSEGDQGPRRGCGTTDGWMGTVKNI